MAQTNFTPISLYYSATSTNVPTAGNLIAGELAINTADGKLFYKDSAGVVQTIASKATGAVAGTTTQVIYNNAGAYAGSANMVFDGSTLTTLNSAYTGTLTGGTGVIAIGTNQIYKDASGNLGIGSTTARNLEVIRSDANTGYGSAAAQFPINIRNTNTTANNWSVIGFNQGTSSYANPAFIGAQYTDSSAAALVFGTSSTERMRIASTGIVTMSAYGAGAATFSAAGVISSVSDETWKIKDGIPANPDEMLQKLEPGYWFYNEEKAPIFGKDRQLGFYAQNVNDAIGSEAAPIPESITTTSENGTETITTKPWGYYDRSVLAVTVMSLKNALTAIQELNAKVDAQAAEIAALQVK